MSAADWLNGLRTGLGTRRLPMILQTEAAECGLACLAMVAAHFGLNSDLPTLRQRFSVSLKGATLADLVRIAGRLQLNSRALRAEMEHLPDLAMPCVLHWDLNHFVVLKEVRRGMAVIHDPARGVRRLALAEVSKHFTGVVLALYVFMVDSIAASSRGLDAIRVALPEKFNWLLFLIALGLMSVPLMQIGRRL